MRNKFRQLKLQMDSLAILAALKKDPVVEKLNKLLLALSKEAPATETVGLYSSIFESLYPVSCNLGSYVSKLVVEDENFYIKAAASNQNIPKPVSDALSHELDVLQNIAMLDAAEIKEAIGYDGFLPAWENGTEDIKYNFSSNVKNIMKKGYGIFAKYSFFRLENSKIVPVSHPEFQPLSQLFGYERERNLIIKNTEALLHAHAASDMLLYGDAGTGKSSSIKSIAAYFAPEGLRIIEVKKNQLYQIPAIMEELAANPLKFIIFIDDLSFTGNDDNFAALKAILEGSVSGASSNVVIYATSNRRHLIKENFADRIGDELHKNDTLQETMSLAARFGLTITFQQPSKEEYLNIVRNLAKEYNVEMDEDELFTRAEAHAIRKNGRSPRTAKQFIELLKIGI